MNKEIKASKTHKMSTKKKILLAAGICLTVAAVSYVILIINLLRNDPSSADPVYNGQIISDENQHPVNNEFNHGTEAMDVVKGIDLKGKLIVITGGHTGTGREAVKAFISARAKVIALAPDVEWAKKNLSGLPNIEIEYLDLSKPASIDAFVKKFLKTNRAINILINSAGVHNTPLERDKRGFENQFAINVLGHFELTLKLLPALKRANGARIVNLSSRGHRVGGVIFDDINFFHTPYNGMRSYAQTKTALALLSVKEDELFKAYNIRTFAVHPGPIPTSDLFVGSMVGHAPEYIITLNKFRAEVLRGLYATQILNFLRQAKNVGDVYKTVQQGGATTTWAAVSPELNNKGGLYLEDCNIAPMVPNGSKAPFGVRPWALNKQDADRLWKICEQMTGVNYK